MSLLKSLGGKFPIDRQLGITTAPVMLINLLLLTSR